MPVAACKVNSSGNGLELVLCLADMQIANIVKAGGQLSSKLPRHVLNDEDRNGKARGQSWQNDFQCCRASRGNSNDHRFQT